MSSWSGQRQGAFLPVLCGLALMMFFEGFHRLNLYRWGLGFLMLFKVLIHPQYLGLCQKTLRLLMLFEAVLRQAPVHRLSHLSLYQQTQGFLMLFEAFLLPVFVHR